MYLAITLCRLDDFENACAAYEKAIEMETSGGDAAEILGGRQLSLASLGDFPSTLPEETLIANTVKIERDLWDTPLWFILIAALAGAEWFLRRKDNLV